MEVVAILFEPLESRADGHIRRRLADLDGEVIVAPEDIAGMRRGKLVHIDTGHLSSSYH